MSTSLSSLPFTIGMTTPPMVMMNNPTLPIHPPSQHSNLPLAPPMMMQYPPFHHPPMNSNSIPNSNHSAVLDATNTTTSLCSQYHSFFVVLSDFSVELFSEEMSIRKVEASSENVTSKPRDVASLRMNFANYKQFITSNQTSCKIVMDTANTTETSTATTYKYEWPSFKQQFYYQTGMIDSLKKRQFVIQCFDFNNLPIGKTINFDLLSICTGSIHQESFILNNHQFVIGKIQFKCQMKQFSDVEVNLKNLNIILPSTFKKEETQDCYLSYGFTSEENSNGSSFKTSPYPNQFFQLIVPWSLPFIHGITQPNPQLFKTMMDTQLSLVWYELLSIYLTQLSLKELLDKNLVIRLMRKKRDVSLAEFSLPLRSIIKSGIFKNSQYPFRQSEGALSTSISGVIEFNNLPLFSQQESQHLKEEVTSENLIHSPSLPYGVNVPQLLHTTTATTSWDDQQQLLRKVFPRITSATPSSSVEFTPIDQTSTTYFTASSSNQMVLECTFKDMLDSDGLGMTHTLTIEQPVLATSSVTAQQSPFKYFEVQILDGGESGKCSIGLISKADHGEIFASRVVGSSSSSNTPNTATIEHAMNVGYSSIDGYLFGKSQNQRFRRRPFGPQYQCGDVVGCGLISVPQVDDISMNSSIPSQIAYFTRNGKLVGFAPYQVEEKDLSFAIVLRSKYMKVYVNFGQEKQPFQFDIHQADISYFNQKLQLYANVQTSSSSEKSINVGLDYFNRVFIQNTFNNKNMFTINPMHTIMEDYVQPINNKPKSKQLPTGKLLEINQKLMNTITNPVTIKYKTPLRKNNEKEEIVKWNGIESNRVLSSLLHIPKSSFSPNEFANVVNYGQFVIDYHLTPEGYDDSIQFNITPSLVAIRALEALQLSKGMKFLEVGSGTGYVTALASFIVGEEGCCTGLDIDENVIGFAKQKLIEFCTSAHGCQYAAQMCEIEFVKKNILIPKSLNIPILSYENFDAIFCGLEITTDTLKYFESVIKTNGKLVASLSDKCLYLFEFIGDSWKRTKLMKNCELPMVVMPSAEDIDFEKRERIREYVNNNFYFSKKDISLAMDILGTDNLVNICQFLMLYSDPALRAMDVPLEQIVHALRLFETHTNITLPIQQNVILFPVNAHFYLLHARNLSHFFQLPLKFIEACLVKFQCNMLQLNPILEQISKQKPSFLTEDDEEEVCHELLAKFTK